MKKRNYWLIMLVAVVILGIGYAAISNVTLSITGSATAKQSAADEDFIVRFIKGSDTGSTYADVATYAANPVSYTVSDGSRATASASVTGDTTATFSVNNIAKDDYVEFTYYVANLSTKDIPAYIYVDVTKSANTNPEYFEVTTNIDDTSLTAQGDVAQITVKVKCKDQKVLESESGSFIVKLTASTERNSNGTDSYTVSNVYSTASTINEINQLFATGVNVNITLTDDVICSSRLYLNGGQDVTLNLNDNNFNCSMEVSDGSNFVLEDSGHGAFTAHENNYALYVYDGSSVTMNSGKIISNDYGVFLNGGSMTINDGEINSAQSAVSSNNTAGTMDLTINGGTFTTGNGNIIYMPSPKSLTINGGTFNGSLTLRMGNVTINGGTFTPLEDSYADAKAAAEYSGNSFTGDVILVLGGTYNTSSAEGNDLNLVINGGTFNPVRDDKNCLTIVNTGKYAQNMNVEISGGTFNKSTNSTRGTFEIVNASDINMNNTYKANNNYVSVNITDGVGLIGGVNITGQYWNTTTPYVNGTTSY